MPILRITYTRPDDGLPPVQELGSLLTEVILSHHALSRWSEHLRTMFRVRLHELPQDRFLMGGQPCARALYDVEYIVPSETLTPDVRDAVADGIVRAVLEWEGVPFDCDEAMRVMLVITDVPHDRWFWGGRAVTPRTILEYLGKLRRGAARVAETAKSVRKVRETA